MNKLSKEKKLEDLFDNKINKEDAKNLLKNLYLDHKNISAKDISIASLLMKSRLIPLNIDQKLREKSIDIVGTGGDQSNSFNISTTSAILLSSIGSYVAKHGNRSVTSKSGSADVLEKLGININNKQERLLEECGFCFMFAQNHHPCMKHIMPIRKEIPHKTIFNILGPLTNPALIKKSLIGVFDKNLISQIIKALQLNGYKEAMVVSSKDNMDEISISNLTYYAYLKDDNIKEGIIDPVKLGFAKYSKEEIIGGNPLENAKITRRVLKGEIKGAKKDIVLLNTAYALKVDNKVRDLKEGLELANEFIVSKKAYLKLEEIIKVSNSL